VVGYRNFELGVLFTSHLPKKPKTKLSPTKKKKPFVYCFQPHQCSCDDTRKANNNNNDDDICDNTANGNLASPPPPQLVHLPVPYEVRPESYFEQQQQQRSTSSSTDNNNKNDDGDDHDDDDDDDGANMLMKENPYFNEILDGSRCVGNMLLTPFGQDEAKQMGLL